MRLACVFRWGSHGAGLASEARVSAHPPIPASLPCSYECPLEALTTFYRPPARLLLAIDNMHSNGAQLTQAGLEFNYRGEVSCGWPASWLCLCFWQLCIPSGAAVA